MASMTSFRTYLSKRRIVQNPTGEFVRQLRDEAEMEQIESWPQLQAFIYRRAPADKVKQAILAAEPLWRGYRAFVLKNRRTGPAQTLR